MARVAVKSGLLKNWYAYHKLSHVSGHGNNLELLGLNHALIGWSMMTTISEREASRNESMVGGQSNRVGSLVTARLRAALNCAVATRQGVNATWPAIGTTTSAPTTTATNK